MTASTFRILIVEDRPPDRLYLSTLLGYSGYTLLEAGNGAEALEIARAQHPDLIISDVLMPKLDGYEFIRRLRTSGTGSTVPVIFYTATYHEDEARALANEIGVFEVLIKPSPPETILARVKDVLARGPAEIATVTDESFDRQHARVTTDKLLQKVRDLEASDRRMAGLVDIGRRFMEERDPAGLLNRLCVTVREATLATYATVGLFNGALDRVTLLLTSGYDARTAEFLRGWTSLPAHLRLLAADRRPVRDLVPDGRPEHIGLPAWHPAVGSHLAVPLSSRDRLYGFVSVAGKIGEDGFSDADEQVAVSIGVQAGVAYENALLINDLEANAAILRENESTTDFALAAAGVGIFERHLRTDAIKVSRGFGADGADPLTGERLYEALHPDDRASVRSAIDAAIARCGDFQIEARAINADGRIGYRQLRGRVVADGRGIAERVVTVVIDMTERRTLEAQLRQAQKMEAIGQLAGGVAHDFNNMLTAILGYAKLLSPALTTEAQREDLAEITNAANRAASLTRQLLTFSRRQAQELSLVNLSTLSADIVKMIGPLIGEHVAVTTDLAPALPGTRADRGQIEQVVVNLIVNARDAMPRGGTLHLATAETTMADGPAVKLTVKDSGTGMTEETKQRLFEPFFTTKEPGKGTGLGLATAYGIVTQSGGTITVDSALGVGSTFTIVLPAASATELTFDSPSTPVLGGDETILLVEDETAVRFLARSILERMGYTVIDADGLDAGLRAAAARAFDLVLTDVIMPGGTGPELVRELRRARQDLRVLYMSGYAKDTILDTRQLGRDAAFLTKPFTEESLARRVREVLDR